MAKGISKQAAAAHLSKEEQDLADHVVETINEILQRKYQAGQRIGIQHRELYLGYNVELNSKVIDAIKKEFPEWKVEHDYGHDGGEFFFS
jgi:hypothetical protein